MSASVTATQRVALFARALEALESEAPRTLVEYRPPRAAATTFAGAVLVVVPIVLAAVGVVSWLTAGIVTTIVFVLAANRVTFAWLDLRKSRTLGDGLLRSHPDAPISGVAAWRAQELTCIRKRKQLQRFTRALLRENEAYLDLVDDAAVRQSLVLLQRLNARLGDLDAPVSACGILAVARLVTTDAWSPLYFPARASELPAALGDALEALEHR